MYSSQTPTYVPMQSTSNSLIITALRGRSATVMEIVHLLSCIFLLPFGNVAAESDAGKFIKLDTFQGFKSFLLNIIYTGIEGLFLRSWWRTHQLLTLDIGGKA